MNAVLVGFEDAFQFVTLVVTTLFVLPVFVSVFIFFVSSLL